MPIEFLDNQELQIFTLYISHGIDLSIPRGIDLPIPRGIDLSISHGIDFPNPQTVLTFLTLAELAFLILVA